MRALSLLAALIFLGACTLPLVGTGESRGEPRRVGTMIDPFCAPDGSVVRLLYPNSQGSFEGTKSSRENCPWYK